MCKLLWYWYFTCCWTLKRNFDFNCWCGMSWWLIVCFWLWWAGTRELGEYSTCAVLSLFCSLVVWNRGWIVGTCHTAKCYFPSYLFLSILTPMYFLFISTAIYNKQLPYHEHTTTILTRYTAQHNDLSTFYFINFIYVNCCDI